METRLSSFAAADDAGERGIGECESFGRGSGDVVAADASMDAVGGVSSQTAMGL